MLRKLGGEEESEEWSVEQVQSEGLEEAESLRSLEMKEKVNSGGVE
jgi:hypothetical protein